MLALLDAFLGVNELNVAHTVRALTWKMCAYVVVLIVLALSSTDCGMGGMVDTNCWRRMSGSLENRSSFR